MGCDGGTIPRRDELIRLKKKPEQKDKEAELAFRWKHCSIKQLPLQEPIVACGLGRLYSKESVLEGLIDRSTLPEVANHIKNLKDVKNLNFTPNPAYNGEGAKNGGYIDDGKSAYICPVTGLEMNGKYKFCFLWNCGCVMSERALKEIKTYTCQKCQKTFTDNDLFIINPDDEEVKKMENRFKSRKAERKSKKRKNFEISSANIEEEEQVKKIKKEKPSKAHTSKNKTRQDPQDPAYKKAKKCYSVAQDPKASEVFKKLFTTHESASERPSAHWVTYNPLYN